MDFDIETIRAELAQVRNTQWYGRLLFELARQKEYYANNFMSCKDMRDVSLSQGAIRALADIESKITRED